MGEDEQGGMPHPFVFDGVTCNSMGKRKKSETILTRTEFVSNLTRIRDNVRRQQDIEKAD